MSQRSQGFRGDTYTYPSFFPAGAITGVYLPCDSRLDNVYVQAGASPTTIVISVNGASIMSTVKQTNGTGGTVLANTASSFKISNHGPLALGSKVSVSSTDGTALISLAFSYA